MTSEDKDKCCRIRTRTCHVYLSLEACEAAKEDAVCLSCLQDD